MFDKYGIKLTFTRGVLATNPCDPNVMDTHILDRQRKLIVEKQGINTQINKYLDQIQISKDKGEDEINKLIDSLEILIGYQLAPEERKDAIAGKLLNLKETLAEMDIKGTTVFFWNKEKNLPCVGDHMIYGFLKAASEAIGRTLPTKKGEMLHSVSYTQSIINQHVRCEERFITFDKDVVRNPDGSIAFLQRSLRAMTAQGPRISLAKSEQVEEGAHLTFTLKVLKNSPFTGEVLNKLLQYGELSGIGQWRNAGWGQFVFETMKLK
jgi:hypothetical protein